jgi:hypothetical protein
LSNAKPGNELSHTLQKGTPYPPISFVSTTNFIIYINVNVLKTIYEFKSKELPSYGAATNEEHSIGYLFTVK